MGPTPGLQGAIRGGVWGFCGSRPREGDATAIQQPRGGASLPRVGVMGILQSAENPRGGVLPSAPG